MRMSRDCEGEAGCRTEVEQTALAICVEAQIADCEEEAECRLQGAPRMAACDVLFLNATASARAARGKRTSAKAARADFDKKGLCIFVEST